MRKFVFAAAAALLFLVSGLASSSEAQWYGCGYGYGGYYPAGGYGYYGPSYASYYRASYRAYRPRFYSYRPYYRYGGYYSPRSYGYGGYGYRYAYGGPGLSIWW